MKYIKITARWNEFTGVDDLKTKGVEASFETFAEAFDAATSDCCGDNGIVKVLIESSESIPTVFSAEYSIPHQVTSEVGEFIRVMQHQWASLIDCPPQEQKRCDYCLEYDVPIDAVQVLGEMCSYCLEHITH